MNVKDIRVGQIIARRRNGQGPRRAMLVERIEQTRGGSNIYYLRGRSARIRDLAVTGCREASMMIVGDLDVVELLRDAPEVTETMRERQAATRARMAADFTERWEAASGRVREHGYGKTAREYADRGEYHRALAWLAEADKRVAHDTEARTAITPRFPEGTPEHTAYAAALRAELARWTAGEVATTPTPEYREWQRVTARTPDTTGDVTGNAFARYLRVSGADTTIVEPRRDCSDPDCAALATGVYHLATDPQTHIMRATSPATLCGEVAQRQEVLVDLTSVDCLVCLDRHAEETRPKRCLTY